MSEYSQGLCSDGAAILKDGQPLTIEQILEALRERDALSKKQGITLTASQLREALYWANPDNTPDEENTEVRIEWMPKRKSTDGEDLAAGDYLYYIDCPEEGVIGPLGQDPVPAPAVLQTAPTVPMVPKEQYDKEILEMIDQRDYWEEKATQLADLVGQHIGYDVGEHSNMNCPVLNAIEWIQAVESQEPTVPDAFKKWLDAFVTVSNLSGIDDSDQCWSWPAPRNGHDFFEGYPQLTTGCLRELHATLNANHIVDANKKVGTDHIAGTGKMIEGEGE